MFQIKNILCLFNSFRKINNYITIFILFIVNYLIFYKPLHKLTFKYIWLIFIHFYFILFIILTYGNKYLSEIKPLSLKCFLCSINNSLVPRVDKLFCLFSLYVLLGSIFNDVIKFFVSLNVEIALLVLLGESIFSTFVFWNKFKVCYFIRPIF